MFPFLKQNFFATILAFRKRRASLCSAVIWWIHYQYVPLLRLMNSHADSAFKALLPPHITWIKLVLVLAHKGLFMNEMANAPAKSSLDGPAVEFFTGLIIGATLKSKLLLQELLRLHWRPHQNSSTSCIVRIIKYVKLEQAKSQSLDCVVRLRS